MHPYQQQIDLCNRALEAVRQGIPFQLLREVHDDINRHEEWGLAIEILIDQISELDIQITQGQFDVIRDAMASMGMSDCNRLRYLREHSVKI